MLIGSMKNTGQGWDEWYPDDLPAEWRFDYFANEFRAVFISESEWLTWDEASWDELDWPEYLSVFVEVSSSTVGEWLSKTELLDENGLAPRATICCDVETLSLVSGAALLKVASSDGGWFASDDKLAVSAIAHDSADLKSLRFAIEGSEAWKVREGVLLFDASAAQLHSISTLVELLA